MNMSPMLKRIAAEFLGTGVFLTGIVGSAASGSPLHQLTLAIALGMGILLASTVGAGHLNPVVSLYFFAKGKLALPELFANIGAQLLGGVGGAWLGITIWGGNLSAPSTSATYAASQVIGEIAATTGLLIIIGQLVKAKKAELLPLVVAAWVFSAGTWTGTGAQANPAVSFALLFSGQSLPNSGAYILAQLGGLLIAVAVLTIMGDPETGKGGKGKKKK
jgi:glycerol uptake facilitator-like aquaporin